MPEQRRGAAPTTKDSATGLQHRGPDRQARPIAEPPARVIYSLRTVGQLRLYGLAERVGFRCSICRQHTTAKVVATKNGDWTQNVCLGCFNLEREKAKKAAQTKRRPAQSMRRTPGKARPKQAKQANGLSASRVTAKVERQELGPRQPGVDRLLGFFHAAGVDAELGPDRRLWINGSQTEPLAHLPSPDTAEWFNVLNEIALKHVRDKFIKAVEDNANFGDGLRAFLLPRERGFAIMRGDARVAVIHAAHAFVPHRPFIYANFLTPGRHWQQVAGVLGRAKEKQAAKPKHVREAKETRAAAREAEVARRGASAQRRMDQLPAHLAPQLIDACLDASRRIRLERQVAYDRPVVLQLGFGELTLLPIAGTGARLRMPFRVSTATETLKGELSLEDRDPLPLVISRGVVEADAVMAWTCALLGFADATCIEFEPPKLTARREPTRQWRPSAAASPRHPSARTLPRQRPWPRHLEPVGHWIRYSGSFVAGHRRHLPDGWTASAEARERARRVGIILHPHETWVQPHARGIPDDIEMRFKWHAPPELGSFIDGARGRIPRSNTD